MITGFLNSLILIVSHLIFRRFIIFYFLFLNSLLGAYYLSPKGPLSPCFQRNQRMFIRRRDSRPPLCYLLFDFQPTTNNKQHEIPRALAGG